MRFKTNAKLSDVMNVIRKKNKGKQAKHDNHCLYRTIDGNCCLVGAFIPDDLYKSEMEDEPASDIIAQYNLHEYMPFSSDIMNDLQTFHDDHLGCFEGEEFFQEIEEYLNNEIY